jgi:hypothetical protein
MRPSALVISPFASAPRDAGHRRRVHQMTKLLADRGHSVTFLLLAFEDRWAWSHDPEAHQAMRADWDDVIVVHAAEHVGRPPVGGDMHCLDEWWDAALQATLVNIAARRFFDVVVVHNVWLSKAFDFVHPASTKLLETHDLFWKRREAFARIGALPSFFLCERDAELFGLARADILVTIQAAEARELLGLTPRRVVNVPFYDDALLDSANAAGTAYGHAEKTSFGFLASANPFNIHGANALLAALEREIGASFAPVEIVVGGAVGRHLRTTLPVKLLGRVASEQEFYAGVDYAIAPVFEGTGFKIKTADALALARPLLAATHAAEGVALDRSLVCADPDEMAARMAEIALRRPDKRAAQGHVRRARADLRARMTAGAGHLLRAVAVATAPVMIDLHDVAAGTGQGALRLQCWLGVVRVLAQRCPVLLVLPQSVRLRIAGLLPPGARAIAAGEVDACIALWPRCLRLVAGELPPPPPHPCLLWDPAALRLREMWTELQPADAALAGMVILQRGLPPRRLAGFATLDAEDAEAVARLVLRLLIAPGDIEIVCAAAPQAALRVVLDVCALRGLAFRGAVDAAALAPAGLPRMAADELARRAEAAALAFTLTSNSQETPCLAA